MRIVRKLLFGLPGWLIVLVMAGTALLLHALLPVHASVPPSSAVVVLPSLNQRDLLRQKPPKPPQKTPTPLTLQARPIRSQHIVQLQSAQTPIPTPSPVQPQPSPISPKHQTRHAEQAPRLPVQSPSTSLPFSSPPFSPPFSQSPQQQPALQPTFLVLPPTPSSQEQSQQHAGDSHDSPPANCTWVYVNVCDLLNTVLHSAVVKPLNDALNTLIDQTKYFLWTTPPDTTYKNAALLHFWDISLWLAGTALAAILAWAALRSMIGQAFSWLSYANMLELLQRIALGLLAAVCSLEFTHFLVDVSNALCKMFDPTILTKMTDSAPDSSVAATLQGIYIFMSILLILEEAARYAILYILIAFSPLWMVAASIRETQG